MASLNLDDRGVIVTCSSCEQKNRLAFDALSQTVRCGRCKEPLSAPGEPLEVTSSVDFDRIVERSSIPVLVDYWAPWCGPCRAVAPEVAKVAMRNAGRLLVLKVNTDVLNDLGARYNIRSIPTMAVFAEGREAARVTGAQPAASIEAFVARATQQPTH
jgi:thioredoxin 2